MHSSIDCAQGTNKTQERQTNRSARKQGRKSQYKTMMEETTISPSDANYGNNNDASIEVISGGDANQEQDTTSTPSPACDVGSSNNDDDNTKNSQPPNQQGCCNFGGVCDMADSKGIAIAHVFKG